MSNLTLIFAMD